MYKAAKNFLRDNFELVESKKFVELYEAAARVAYALVQYLTSILLSCNINPLEYMNFIPHSYLSTADIPFFDIPANVDTIEEDAFFNCTSLEIINLSNISKIGNDAFRNCFKLKEIDLRNLKSCGSGAFADCHGLTRIILPEDLYDDYGFIAAVFLDVDLDEVLESDRLSGQFNSILSKIELYK